MKIVLATHNPGKLAEFQRMFDHAGVTFVGAGDLDLPEPEETGETFTENALIKARAACAASGLPALADDSGLSLAALGGDPGVYSARWAGPSKDFGKAMSKIQALLEDKADGDRRAAFICVLALVFPDGRTHVFEGRVDGDYVWPPRGDQGFGYDPAFQPDGYDCTFAEMTADEKAALSHRGRAVQALLKSGVLTE